MTDWYHRRRRSVRILLVALPLVVLLSAGYLGVRALALRSADHLTITVTRLEADASGPADSVVYRRTFEQALSSRAEQLLNDDTVAHGPFSPLGGTLPFFGSRWHYHLAFTWHGLLVETADYTHDIVPVQYTISALGLPELSTRWAEDSHLQGYSLIEALSEASGVTIPLPPTVQLGG
ncbi:MAG: hypothetical protein ACRDHE_11580 [Ktedonobacterales bacterium]